jgi:hypothetical protein
LRGICANVDELEVNLKRVQGGIKVACCPPVELPSRIHSEIFPIFQALQFSFSNSSALTWFCGLEFLDTGIQ